MTRLNLRNPCGGSSVRGVQIRHSYLLDRHMSQALCLVSVEFSGVGSAGGQAFSATVIDAQACRSCTCNDVPWSEASSCVRVCGMCIQLTLLCVILSRTSLSHLGSMNHTSTSTLFLTNKSLDFRVQL